MSGRRPRRGGAVTQPLKFAVVGTGGYVVSLVVFAGMYTLGIPYVVASIASYLVSNALMYLGNRYFTFRVGHGGFWSAYVRYLAVGVVVAGLNALVLALLVEVMELHPTPGQAVSLIVITPVAFVLIKRWTFQVAPR